MIINNKKIVGTEQSVNPGDLGLFAGADDKFYNGFTSSLLFTASVYNGLSQTYSTINKMVKDWGTTHWNLLMSFDTDVSVDQMQFAGTNFHNLGQFNVWAKKL